MCHCAWLRKVNVSQYVLMQQKMEVRDEKDNEVGGVSRAQAGVGMEAPLGVAITTTG
jgi:hypothetical protein